MSAGNWSNWNKAETTFRIQHCIELSFPWTQLQFSVLPIGFNLESHLWPKDFFFSKSGGFQLICNHFGIMPLKMTTALFQGVLMRGQQVYVHQRFTTGLPATKSILSSHFYEASCCAGLLALWVKTTFLGFLPIEFWSFCSCTQHPDGIVVTVTTIMQCWPHQMINALFSGQKFYFPQPRKHIARALSRDNNPTSLELCDSPWATGYFQCMEDARVGGTFTSSSKWIRHYRRLMWCFFHVVAKFDDLVFACWSWF